jgi:hypothetical protein
MEMNMCIHEIVDEFINTFILLMDETFMIRLNPWQFCINLK